MNFEVVAINSIPCCATNKKKKGVIAKVIRDNLMKKLSYKYPGFFWNKNSGYGTKLHIDKIKLLGITPHHRKSFKPITKMIK